MVAMHLHSHLAPSLPLLACAHLQSQPDVVMLCYSQSNPESLARLARFWLPAITDHRDGAAGGVWRPRGWPYIPIALCGLRGDEIDDGACAGVELGGVLQPSDGCSQPATSDAAVGAIDRSPLPCHLTTRLASFLPSAPQHRAAAAHAEGWRGVHNEVCAATGHNPLEWVNEEGDVVEGGDMPHTAAGWLSATIYKLLLSYEVSGGHVGRRACGVRASAATRYRALSCRCCSASCPNTTSAR